MTTSSLASTAATRTGQLRHIYGFWVVAAAFLTVMAFATVPTALYAIYQARNGFNAAVVTAVFAAFAVGVMLSLYVAGHLSDTLGRRPMILASIGFQVLSAAVFLQSSDLTALVVARLLCGIGVGTLTATATAHLGELLIAARPDDGAGVARTVAGVANIGGLALGALAGGALAEVVDAPLHTPYTVFLVLLVVAATAVAFVPETVVRRAERPPYRPQRVAVPPSARATFAAAAAAVFAAFAVFGVFTSLSSTFLVAIFHQHAHLIAGAVVFAVFGAAAAAQLAGARRSVSRQLAGGAAATVLGLAIVVAGALAPSIVAFVAGGAVAGAGAGLIFQAAVALAGGLAPADRRGEVLAALFLVAYAGITVPVLAVGGALLVVDAERVLGLFALTVAALVIITTTRLRRTLRPA